MGEIADPQDRYSFSGGPFGSNLKREEYTSSGIRIIQLQNIGDGHFKNDYKIYTSERKADELMSCNIFPREIILSKMGDPVARAVIIPCSEERYLMASDGIRLKVDESRFDTFFILNAINSPEFRSSAEAVAVGTTRKRIGLTTLKKLTISAPPLPEQRKIAEIISGIDRTIARYLQKREKLSKLRSALRSDLLSGRKGSWGMSDMEWLSGTLQDIARPANDKWIPSQNENSIPYIGLEHILPENPKVADHGKSSEVISTKNKFKKGDTLFGKLRPYLQKVAFADFTGICSTDIIPIRASAETDPAFLYYLISSPKVIAKAIESSAGNVMPRASWQDIRGIEIAIPPLPEQKKIAEILSGVDHQMATLLDAEKKYVSLKQAIAADLFSGRKRVSV
ncbi:MAG: restriction endonuclease subunit S [Cyanobacteria bacterium MAG CAR2_bin_4]|nr:restriction endonuclease subunit S [Cyanobacteria bacterium MAG CAR2_bin_4]